MRLWLLLRQPRSFICSCLAASQQECSRFVLGCWNRDLCICRAHFGLRSFCARQAHQTRCLSISLRSSKCDSSNAATDPQGMQLVSAPGGTSLHSAPRHEYSKSVIAYSRQPSGTDSVTQPVREGMVPGTPSGDAAHRQTAPKQGSELQGLLFMAAVACMWGTSPVATRALYAQPGPPSPAALGTAQATMAFLWLTLLNRFAARLPWAQPPSNESSLRDPQNIPEQSALIEPSRTLESASGDEPAANSEQGCTDDVERQSASAAESTKSLSSGLQGMRRAVAGILNRPASSQLAAGAELGAISAAANAATLLGFEDTLAARGSFLLRMSVMFTPVLGAIAGQQTPQVVWLGAGTAFAGGLLIAGDNLSSQGQHSSSLLNLSGGDVMLIIAALLWALQVCPTAIQSGLTNHIDASKTSPDMHQAFKRSVKWLATRTCVSLGPCTFLQLALIHFQTRSAISQVLLHSSSLRSNLGTIGLLASGIYRTGVSCCCPCQTLVTSKIAQQNPLCQFVVLAETSLRHLT